MMIDSLKKVLSRNITNARGWKTNRKFVVIESDDWGSIRMPNKKAYNELLKNGIRVDKSKYDTLDCLESREDLNNIFGILNSIKNLNGQNPVFTFNTVMQNPDFESIKESRFENFIGESFTTSYERYNKEDYFFLWEKASNENIMFPQFHAREHLNSYLWLRDLRKGNKDTLLAFQNYFFGLKTNTSSKFRNHYLATYHAESPQELDYIKRSVTEGLKQFNLLFGMSSETFIACNYVWPKALEKHLYNNQIKSLQGLRVQLAPSLRQKKLTKIGHYSGQRNLYDQFYTVRNVIFEPYSDDNKDWVNSALTEIKSAFKWNTPAIISSHRINYVGGMSFEHRDKNLRLLSVLLKRIIYLFPDVEFISSAQLSKIMHNENSNSQQ